VSRFPTIPKAQMHEATTDLMNNIFDSKLSTSDEVMFRLDRRNSSMSERGGGGPHLEELMRACTLGGTNNSS